MLLILYRFWDTATYWLKIVHLPTLRHSAPPLPMFRLEFRGEVNHEETRVMGLSYTEDRMIVAGVVLTWYRTVSDGRNLSLLIQHSASQVMLMRCKKAKIWRLVSLF